MEKTHEFLIVKELIEEDDPDTEITTLYFVVEHEREEVFRGDDYHEKIDNIIEGFFEGFDYAGVNYTVTTISWEDE